MTIPPPDSRRSEWMAELEELADLAAETVAPAEVPEARRRRQGYSPEGLVSVLAGGATIGVEPDPELEASLEAIHQRELVPEPVPGGVAAPAKEVPFVAAPSASPPAVPTATRPPRRRRTLATGLAVLGAVALCAGVLLHLPAADPTPLTGGPGYTTPSPEAGSGGVAMQPVPLDPASPAPIVSAPLSSQAPGVSAVRPSSPGGAAPAPPPGIRQTPVVLIPASAAPAPSRTAPPTTAPPATAPPATAPPTAAPTAAPTAPPPSPSATPTGPVTVRSVTLTMGTCQNRGSWWVCPETAVFDFAPGSSGTLTYSIAGVDVTCSGAQSAFDQAQPSVGIPAGTTRATVTSAIVFPADSHPGAPGPGRAPSSAAVHVISPNRISSASQPFAGASCP
jgi:hypothetical protein